MLPTLLPLLLRIKSEFLTIPKRVRQHHLWPPPHNAQSMGSLRVETKFRPERLYTGCSFPSASSALMIPVQPAPLGISGLF